MASKSRAPVARPRRSTEKARPRKRSEPKRPDPRVRLDVDERRAQLLELGLRIFGSQEYESIAIDDIAEHAGMSKGLLYHYFSSKRGFYVAVVRYAAERLRGSIDPDMTLPPLERLEVAIENYLDFVETRDVAYLALMRSGVGSDPEVFEILEETRLDLLGRIARSIGQERPAPLMELALRAWIGAVETATLEWLGKRHVDRKALVRLLTDMLVHIVLGPSHAHATTAS